MGYPMTYQRVIQRNGLYEGPAFVHLNLVPWTRDTLAKFNPDVDRISLLLDRDREWSETVTQMVKHLAAIKDDLRRLERDAVDEKSVCRLIHLRTGVPLDVVAGVLAEFMRQ